MTAEIWKVQKNVPFMCFQWLGCLCTDSSTISMWLLMALYRRQNCAKTLGNVDLYSLITMVVVKKDICK